MDWESLQQPRHLSLPDHVSLELEKFIFSGRLEPGAKLPTERELSSLFGVSRSSIRQALTSLEARNLVRRTPGMGTVVLGPGDSSAGAGGALNLLNKTDPELRFIMELRLLLEPAIAELAATRAQKRDYVHLHEILSEMSSTVDKEAYAELDRLFHERVAQCTYNPLLIAINSHIADQISPSRADRYQSPQRRKVSTQAHYRIYEAILKRDAAGAEAAARDHIRDIAETIASELKSNTGL